MKKPDFFIVGAPKCGTTAMHTYLKQHPDIFMSEYKEPHYFGSDLKLDTNERTLERYLSLFKNAGNEKRIGEASPSYLYSKRAAYEIKEFNEKSRIIIIIRNPIEMLYSVYYHRLYAGSEKLKNFEDAIFSNGDKVKKFRSKVERKIGMRLPDYLKVPKFSEQIKRYFDVFGRDRVHVIIFDDFKKDIEQIYRKVLDFLDVDETYRPEFYIVNPNKRSRSRFIKNLLKINNLTCANKPGKIKTLAKKFLLLVRVKRKIEGFNTVYFQRPEMDPETRKKLQIEFTHDVEQLSKLLERDLTHWVKE